MDPLQVEFALAVSEKIAIEVLRASFFASLRFLARSGQTVENFENPYSDLDPYGSNVAAAVASM